MRDVTNDVKESLGNTLFLSIFFLSLLHSICVLSLNQHVFSDFRDRIIKTSLAFNHLVVATTSQCYIYRYLLTVNEFNEDDGDYDDY